MAPLKTHFSRDCGVGAVLESSCMPYTLRFSARHRLALIGKSEFLEVPLNRNQSLAGWISAAYLPGSAIIMVDTPR